jgi:hypothetical protein
LVLVAVDPLGQWHTLATLAHAAERLKAAEGCRMTDSADLLEPNDSLVVQIAELDNRVHMATGLLLLLEGAPEMFQAALQSRSCSDQIVKTQASRQKLMVARQRLCDELERQRRVA